MPLIKKEDFSHDERHFVYLTQKKGPGATAQSEPAWAKKNKELKCKKIGQP